MALCDPESLGVCVFGQFIFIGGRAILYLLNSSVLQEAGFYPVHF